MQAAGEAEGQQGESRSGRARGLWPRGPEPQSARAGVASWRTAIHTCSGSSPAHPFLGREGEGGPMGVFFPTRRGNLHPPPLHTHTPSTLRSLEIPSPTSHSKQQLRKVKAGGIC